jgi:hypothetical protein
MTRPEQPEPKQRSKATLTVTTPTGYTFEYCIDSSECDVTDELNTSKTSLYSLFEQMNNDITNFYNYTDSINTNKKK